MGKIRHFRLIYTPNANMADHSVGARDESNGSEASEALMFCFDNAIPEKCCFVVDLVLLFRPPYVILCYRVESSTAEKVIFFSVSPFASEEKARSSRSPKERPYSLLKFRLESILEKCVSNRV